ncbi:MAG: porin [Ginsengibacter sp.]
MDGYTQFILKSQNGKLITTAKVFLFVILQIFLSICGIAQQKNGRDSIQPKVIFTGLFQARYLVSLTKDVDVMGLHHPDGNGVSNTFDVRRARAQFTARISDRTEAVLLVNLADFKSDPKNKVLENAYLTYRLNPLMQFKIGQFRPAFGLEDTYSVNIIKSFDYSNQYTSFGTNGWQSFQIGLGMFGDFKGAIPFRYELDVVNGNNKNQVSDDDNGKQVTLRFQIEPVKKIKIGINAGYGARNKEKIYAAGIDLSAILPLQNKFSLEFDAEYKRGNNHALFFSLDTLLRNGNINDYQMSGYYFLPNLRYNINFRRLTSIELSCRYEYLNTDVNNQDNPQQTLTPMIGFEFLKAYNARIQIGIVSDWYKKNIISTNTNKRSLFILQVQTKM